MSYQYLRTEQQGRVLTVQFDNPPVNFLTSAMMVELNQLCCDIEADAGIGAVILTSAQPDVFLTHFDVTEIKALATGLATPLPSSITGALGRAEAMLERLPGARKLIEQTPLLGVAQTNQFHATTARMRAMDKVFIAAISGRAMGGGFELALACDLRLIADGSVEGGQMLGLPEIYIGLIPGGGGTQMLTRTVGVARALELCLEGRLLSPNEACDLGLVNRVVAADALMTEATEMAERMARRSPAAVHAIKRCVHQGASSGLDAGMQIEKAEFMAIATQETTRRAMTVYADAVEALIASGKALGIEDFKAWMDGTAVDLTAD